jgi:hypothetical protein
MPFCLLDGSNGEAGTDCVDPHTPVGVYAQVGPVADLRWEGKVYDSNKPYLKHPQNHITANIPFCKKDGSNGNFGTDCVDPYAPRGVYAQN